jgi:outer membrane receptor protein involved in Fe transport
MINRLLLFLALPFFGTAQINGTLLDETSKAPIYGAKIVASDGQRVLSDLEGKFLLKTTTLPLTVVFSAQTYLNDTIVYSEPGKYTVSMRSEVQEIKTVVVTAGRRDQNIEDIAISMEIIRPELIDNKGLSNLEEAVDQSPGVHTMDGQVSIRGGSGFAYGAGSRVLLLWNGVPIMSADAGDAKWNTIPMESASQIEIMKGASSVLYGSGALNGIISLTEREPGLKPETRVKIQSGIYDNPKRASLRWWTKNPTFHQADFYHGRMFKRFGVTVGANAYTNPGYKQGEQEDRARINGSLYFRPESMKNLKAGIGYNVQYAKTANFIIWESDSLAYTPSGTADTSLEESTLTYQRGLRLTIDPYLKLIDKHKNIHSLKTRYYLIVNDNISNPAQSSNSDIYYADYQFQTKWDNGIVLTSGATYTRNNVRSNLFDNHDSDNLALYTQYEHSIGKLDLTGGLRIEHFEQDNKRGDTYFYFNQADSSAKLPVYPIVRFGAHYEVAKASHLRASFGQGIRYPAVAERYTSTSVGALNVFMNPNLRPETGWAAEIGFKQGVKIGDKWKGYMDVAGFINQYNDMMEFQFGIFNPNTSKRLDLNNPDDLNEYLDLYFAGVGIEQMLGFAAVNAEKARITGVEFSFNSIGEIKDVKLTSLLGYTYMNPVSLNNDSAYVNTFSTYNLDTKEYDPMLKYRFNHLVKADVEAEWKGISLGFSARYNSNMTNIDRVFEEEIVAGTFILPGLKDYRREFNKGNMVFDARIAYAFSDHYRVSFIANNILNEEYSSRPGDVQPPRNFLVQLQMKF